MNCCPKTKCLWLPRPVGAALGLLAIIVGISIQLSFLSVQLVQGVVMMLFMPLAPLSLSWVVNHLYATPIGRVHVWAFQLFRRCFANGPHSASIRVDFVVEPYVKDGESDAGPSSPSSSLPSSSSVSVSVENAPRLVVHTVACLMDNYCYLLVDHSGAPPYSVAAVDPSDPYAVLAALRELAKTQYGGRGLPPAGSSGGHESNEREFDELDAAAAHNSEAGGSPVAAPMLGGRGKAAYLPAPSGEMSGGERSGGGGRSFPASADDGFSDVLRLESILTTHRHWDHAYGNPIIKRLVPSCTRVYGGREDDVPGGTHPLDDGDVLHVGNVAVRAISTPCHTRGSLCYHVRGFGGKRDALFTGDTLFTGGCGAPFEGDADEMSRCFQRIWLESAPGTMLFPGHEYGEAILPEYFRGSSAAMPLPSHPKDYAKLTDQYWRTHRNRRYTMPPLPSVPVALENEMAYNAYFGSLHLATDAVSAVMRRQRMAYPEVTASRARARARSSTRSSGRGGGGGGGVTGRSPAARSGGFGGGMAAYGGYGGYSPRDRGGGGGGGGREGPTSSFVRQGQLGAMSEALPCPPGLDPEVWAAMTPGMRQEMLQEMAAQMDFLQAQQESLRHASPTKVISLDLASSSSSSSPSHSSSSPRRQPKPLTIRRSASPTINPAHERASGGAGAGDARGGDSGGGEGTVGGAPSATEADDGEGSSGEVEGPSSGAAAEEEKSGRGEGAEAAAEDGSELPSSSLEIPIFDEATAAVAEGADEDGDEKEEEGDLDEPLPPPSQQSSPVPRNSDDAATTAKKSQEKNAASAATAASAAADDGAPEAKEAAEEGKAPMGGAPPTTAGDSPEDKPDTSGGGWSLVNVQEAAISRTVKRDSMSGMGAYAVDYGAYSQEVTMETLVSSLEALCAGGGRIRVRDLYRALTTLGNNAGTDQAAKSGIGGASDPDGGWRGLEDAEARELIDMMNLPQTVLATAYEDFHRSDETIVVEYAASLFSAVCDDPLTEPPKTFLAYCTKCKLCGTSQVRSGSSSGGSEDADDGDASSSSSSSSSSAENGDDGAGESLANAVADSGAYNKAGDAVILRSDSEERGGAAKRKKQQQAPRSRLGSSPGVELPQRDRDREDSRVVSATM